MPASYVMKVSSNGQVSIPAETPLPLGARIGCSSSISATASCCGHCRIDPVGALVGKYRGRGPSTDEARVAHSYRGRQRGEAEASVTAVLDAYAILALLKDEPAASQVRGLVGAGDATLTTLGVAEVVDHLVRIVGVPEEDAALDLAQLGLADPHVLDAGAALRAGLLRRAPLPPNDASSEPGGLCRCRGCSRSGAPGGDIGPAPPRPLPRRAHRRHPAPRQQGRHLDAVGRSGAGAGRSLQACCALVSSARR